MRQRVTPNYVIRKTCIFLWIVLAFTEPQLQVCLHLLLFKFLTRENSSKLVERAGICSIFSPDRLSPCRVLWPFPHWLPSLELHQYLAINTNKRDSNNTCMALKLSHPSHEQVWAHLWQKSVFVLGKRLVPVHTSSVGSLGDTSRMFP